MKNFKPNIVWLASYPKSGNTWFRIFLSNVLSADDAPVHINAIPESKIASDRSLIDDISGVNSSDLLDEEVDILRPEVYREVSAGSPDKIFLKVHDAWTLNSMGRAIFPVEISLAVIYIIRNPLDIAVSFARHQDMTPDESLLRLNDEGLSLSGNPGKLSNQCRQKLLNWSGHVRSWVDDSGLPVHVIRYEDMLSQPDSTFSSALNFLNISYENERLKKALTFSSFKRLREQELKEGFLEKPIEADTFFHSGQADQWRKQLDPESVRSFISRNRELMQRFNYVPNRYT